MTVDLSFEVDEAVVSAHRAEGLPLGAEPDLLEWTYFRLPVRLAVNGADLTKGRRLPLPLLGIGPVGLFRLRQAREKGESRILMDGGDISLKVGGDIVTIYSGQTRRTAKASFLELEDAWSDFAERVRRFLIERFPELAEHH